MVKDYRVPIGQAQEAIPPIKVFPLRKVFNFEQ